VADAYLTTVLNWANSTGIDLGKWPAVQAYFNRLRKWPSVARAMAEEFALYKNEKAPQTAA
jgi:glutathione S-transferase